MKFYPKAVFPAISFTDCRWNYNFTLSSYFQLIGMNPKYQLIGVKKKCLLINSLSLYFVISSNMFFYHLNFVIISSLYIHEVKLYWRMYFIWAVLILSQPEKFVESSNFYTWNTFWMAKQHTPRNFK